MKTTTKETNKEYHRWWHFLWTTTYQEISRSRFLGTPEYIFITTECVECGYKKVVTKHYKGKSE